MIPDGTYTAVVDRIEDGLATLEVSGDEERYELTIEPDDLPGEARHANAILDVQLEDGELVAATYRPEESDERAEQAQDRFDRLSRRPPEPDERD